MDIFPVNIEVNRKKVWISIVGSLLLIACLLGFLWLGAGKNGLTTCLPVTSLYAFAGIIPLSILLTGRFKLLLRKTPLLVLESKGIHAPDPELSGLGIIPWTAVTHCADFHAGWNKGRQLFIYVRDPFTYLNRISDLKERNRFTRDCLKHGNALLRIDVTFAADDLTELKRMIFRLIELHKKSAE